MAVTQISQKSEFECSYLMSDATLRSIRYRVEATVTGNQHMIDQGYILEFSQFRTLLDSVLPSNAFIYSGYGEMGIDNQTTIALLLKRLNIKAVGYPFEITTENLCNEIAKQLQELLNNREPGVTVIEVKLQENGSSCACWHV